MAMQDKTEADIAKDLGIVCSECKGSGVQYLAVTELTTRLEHGLGVICEVKLQMKMCTKCSGFAALPKWLRELCNGRMADDIPF